MIYFLDEGRHGSGTSSSSRSQRCGRAVGLDAVDHISQTMNYEEMLTWLLFYTGILDLQRRRRSRSLTRPAWCRARR